MALSIVVLFAFSNMPKRYLHHWFANHKDVVSAQVANYPGEHQIHSEGISCDCNNLVATSPFTAEEVVYSILLPISYGQPIIAQPSDTYHTELVLQSLRGPPALA